MAGLPLVVASLLREETVLSVATQTSLAEVVSRLAAGASTPSAASPPPRASPSA